MARVISRVPRGFTRYYVLHLLREKPMTGKEIIEEAERRSEGAWRPSPGLIYPLLGRLVRDRFIEEGERGRFNITPDGEKALTRYSQIHRQFERQFRIVRKLGLSILSTGKFLVEDALDGIMAVTSMVQEAVAKGSQDLQKSFNARYRAFLEGELRRLDEGQGGASE